MFSPWTLAEYGTYLGTRGDVHGGPRGVENLGQLQAYACVSTRHDENPAILRACGHIGVGEGGLGWVDLRQCRTEVGQGRHGVGSQWVGMGGMGMMLSTWGEGEERTSLMSQDRRISKGRVS